MSSEPRTVAGRDTYQRYSIKRRILAIEAQARIAALDEARAAVVKAINSGAYRCPDCQSSDGPCIDEQYVLLAIDALRDADPPA